MKVLKYGNKLLVSQNEHAFRCTSCNCSFTAESSECVQLDLPMQPNIYAWCPKCRNQTWCRSDLEVRYEDDIHSLDKTNIEVNKLLIDLYNQLGISPSVLSHDTATSIYQRELYKHLYGKKSDNDD